MLRAQPWTLVDNNGADMSNGFTLALMEQSPTSLTRPIQSYDIVAGVHIARPTDVARYYTYGSYYVSSYQPNWTQQSPDNAHVTLRINNGSIEGLLVSPDNNTPPVVLFTMPIGDAARDLYPVIFFHGDSTNTSVRRLVSNTDPFQHPASSNEAGEDTGDLGAVPVPYHRPTNNFIDFSGESLATFLGFQQQRYPLIGATLAREFGIVAETSFEGLDFSDAFIIELQNLPLDSYDGHTGQRQNDLAIVPKSNDNSTASVLYAPPFAMFIDIKNKDTLYLRNIRARILNTDRSPVRTLGLASLTLMVS